MILLCSSTFSMTRFYSHNGPGDIPAGPEVIWKTKQKLCHYGNYLKKLDKNESAGLWTGISSSLFGRVSGSLNRRNAAKNS
jgi:hypothetical protein